jgi:4-amino-4-deoxy-L-arabinose transferase-like glycosyltransferase
LSAITIVGKRPHKIESQTSLEYSHRFLLAVAVTFGAALLIRLVWIHYWPRSIESEGVYYASIAQNLLSGQGYVGIRPVGKLLLYPPLYPSLITGVLTIVKNSELAGRLVSVVFGSLWIVPMMLIAGSLFGEAAGIITGIFAALSPPLIAISGTVQSEPVYLAFQATGIYFALQIWPRSKLACTLAGISFGLAYLARPEASIYVVLAILFIWWRGHDRVRPKAIAYLLLAFGLTILPYVTWLSVQTGQLRLEAKSVSNYVEARGWAQGRPPGEIFFAVDPQLHEVGLSNQSDLAMIRQTKLSTGKVFWLAMHGATKNVRNLLTTILESRLFGGALFILLVGIGAIGVTADRDVLARRVFLFVACTASIVPLFSLHAFHDRFVFPFLTFLLPFAGYGVVRLFESVRSILANLVGGDYRFAVLGAALAGCAAASVATACLMLEGHTMLHLETEVKLPAQDITVRRGDPFLNQIGETIRGLKLKHPLVMDANPAIGFYAGASDWPLPYCDSETAVRYIEKTKPDVVVLQASNAGTFPYVEEWMRTGLPDSKAKLVFTGAALDGDSVQIYLMHE